MNNRSFSSQLNSRRDVDLAEVRELVRQFSDAPTGPVAKAAEQIVEGSGWRSTEVYNRVAALQRSLFAAASKDELDLFASTARLFQNHLRDSVDPLERLFAATHLGIAFLDAGGRALAHNPALERMAGGSDFLTQPITEWFEKSEDVATALADLAGGTGDRFHFRRLTLRGKAEAEPRVAGVELGRIAGNEGPVAYAVLNDLTHLVAAERRAYEMADLGVATTDTTGTIVYCNPRAAEMLSGRPEDFVGKRSLDLAETDADRALLMQSMRNREEGETAVFEVRMKALNGQSRRVAIASFPIADLDGKRFIGSQAFIHLAEPERLNQELATALATLNDPAEMVRATSQTIARLIPHDRLVFVLYDETGRWSWPAHVEPPLTEPWTQRWFRSSEAVMEKSRILDGFGNLRVGDPAEWMKDLPPNDDLHANETVQRLIAEGVRSTLTIPILDGERFTAAIVLMRMGGEPFREADSRFARELGLREIETHLVRKFRETERAALETLSRDTRQILTSSRASTVPDAGVGSRHERAGALICSRLATIYRWRSVALFRVDEGRSLFFRLAGHDAEQTSELLQRQIPFGACLMSAALEKNAPVELEGRGKGPSAYHTWAESGVSLPIRLNGRIVWMLTVEDPIKHSLGPQDITTLTDLVVFIEDCLSDVYIDSFLKDIFERASDAILVVDHAGRIEMANARAAILSGRPAADALKGLSLADVLLDEEDAAVLMSAQRVRELRSGFRTPDGTAQHCLFYSVALDNGFGVRIVYGTDLLAKTWHFETKLIEGTLAAAARQSNASIARLGRLVAEVESGTAPTAEWVRRAKACLADIPLTYERISRQLPTSEERFGGRKVIDLRKAVHEAADGLQLGASTKEWLSVRGSAEPILVDATPDDLHFALKSILDYLGRQKADDRRVRASVRAASDKPGSEGRACVELRGETMARLTPSEDPFESAYEAGEAIAQLGEEAIRHAVEVRNGGAYSRTRQRARGGDEAGGTTEIFRIELPRSGFSRSGVAP